MSFSRSRIAAGEHDSFSILEDPQIRQRKTQRRTQVEGLHGETGSGGVDMVEDAEQEEQESEEPLDPVVQEDIDKFEESFKGITQRYRLIDRIGEG